jgi:diaminopimelate epimerase
MPTIPFSKATACGNDFILIEGMHAPADMAAFTRTICDRRLGLGADGVEWLFPTPDADIKARLFNADGGEAEISGNGTRCVAAWLLAERGADRNTTRDKGHDFSRAEQPRIERGFSPGNADVVIQTLAGNKRCTLIARRGLEFEFEMDMGEPEVGDVFPIKLAFGEARGIPIGMGNPQYIVFVDDFLPGWQAEAAEISRHHDFKFGTNVEFVCVRDRHTIEIRICERGVGETQSSGTGSCASAVAAIAAGKCDSPVQVIAPGGTQTVRWDGSVLLRGSARLVAKGEFFFDV